MTAPFVGQLTFFRVYSGFVKAGDMVYNPTRFTSSRNFASEYHASDDVARSAQCSSAATL